MKIAKEFRWEMGHRLPDHPGLCRNIHGHSYKMVVELEGEVLKNGMIIDFYNLGLIVKPIIEKLDHAFLVNRRDSKVYDFLKKNKMKMAAVDYSATVENICTDMLGRIVKEIRRKKVKNISAISLKIYETPNSFAEMNIHL
ncbi:MAG: 6-carboxytetrahydropterin synthase [Ignavibacteria bacterium]|nr:6-carboxytetrahydropterin synthase [Ignavibacteria bacterium]